MRPSSLLQLTCGLRERIHRRRDLSQLALEAVQFQGRTSWVWTLPWIALVALLWLLWAPLGLAVAALLVLEELLAQIPSRTAETAPRGETPSLT